MSDDPGDIIPADDTPQPIPFQRPDGSASAGPQNGNGPPRVNRMRLALILVPLGMLAVVSTVFGMMMAVASDLPQLETREEFKHSRKSVMLDIRGNALGVITGRENRILSDPEDISLPMQHAIIAIEDQRFYENEGVDPKAIGRALLADVTSGQPRQGGSTITQQFVKNALEAQNDRTVFQKLRESALAYHLTRKWSKRKILTEYLNRVYFGNGAYGVESAARIYFGSEIACGSGPDDSCASKLTAPQAALLAGMVASPAAYDPIANPQAATQRRNLVLRKMLEQGRLTRPAYEQFIHVALPTRGSIRLPSEQVTEPSAAYFTTWVQQQVIRRFGAPKALNGGLVIKTTLDRDLQRAAKSAIDGLFSDPSGPTASLVAIDNETGEVRAMVGGRDYDRYPFNLATQGQRQPGSAFKPFILAAALQRGVSPYSVWASRPKEFPVPNSSGREVFEVNNFNNDYAGARSLVDATTQSDNSVYSEVGIKIGINRVARMAKAMGIRTPVSRNYAVTLGGMREGVTPLDMAHAFQTLAQKGQRVWGTLGAEGRGPVGINEVRIPGEGTVHNLKQTQRVLAKRHAETAVSILQTVVSSGTGTQASIGGFAAGKTGTTENSADAWFVGFNEKYTVAVWVGHPDKLKPMLTEYNGRSVTGGTYPAMIWRDFMVQAMEIDASRMTEAERAKAQREGRLAPPVGGDSGTGTGEEPPAEPQGPPPAPAEPPPAPAAPGGGGGGAVPEGPPAGEGGGAAAPGTG
jgi:penicillin-binding protein 1A